MRVNFVIDESDGVTEEEYLNLSQDFKKFDDEDTYFPVTTNMSFDLTDPTWMNVIKKVVEAIEMHFGYKVKDDVKKVFSNES